MTKKHKHGVTANTTKCFSTFIGCTVRGILNSALPIGRRDLASGNCTLVFDCGWGLTISGNGSHWTECPDDIRRAIEIKQEELSDTNDEIAQVLKLAGQSL